MEQYKVIQTFPGCNGIGYKYIANSDGMIMINNRAINPVLWSEYLEEIKEPILISEDGIEMFNGDHYWYIENYEISEHIIYNNVTVEKDSNVFSTKEAAEKWIDENKPKFSESDIEKAIKNIMKIHHVKAEFDFITELRQELEL